MNKNDRKRTIVHMDENTEQCGKTDDQYSLRKQAGVESPKRRVLSIFRFAVLAAGRHGLSLSGVCALLDYGKK